MANKTRPYLKVVNEISALISQGEFPVGSRLPAERELSERLGVTRKIIREAIIALEVKEEVSVKAGSGVYVLNNKFVNADACLETRAFELLEAHALLEGESAAFAARMITSEKLKALADALKLTKVEYIEDSSYFDAVRQFHTIIAGEAHNHIIASQIHFLWDIQENLELLKLSHQPISSKERESRIQGHIEIYNAIATGKSNNAREAMRDHFKNLMVAMHEASERQTIEDAKQKVSEMRQRFSIGVLAHSH